MRGELGAGLRTVLVVVGFVVLFAGIVTLAYPPLLSNYVFTDQQTAVGTQQGGPGPGGGPVPAGPTLETSFVAIVWGLTLVAAGLAVPGTASFGIREQPFTRRQRLFTLVGAVFVVVVPAAVGAVVLTTNRFTIAVIPAALLALVGAVLVLLGASNGLK